MTIGADVLEGGFADAARDAQATFRAVLAALAEPGTVRPIAARARPPAPLSPEAGAVLLTLADGETPVLLAPAFAPAASWLGFQTGAPVTFEPGEARLAVLETPETDGFAIGTDAYPDRSATVIVPVSLAGTAFTLSGPGIPGERQIDLSLPSSFAALAAANRELYPRGVDFLLVAEGAVIGLPRTTVVLCT